MKKVGVIGFGRIGRIISKILLSYGSIREIKINSLDYDYAYLEELEHINSNKTRITPVKKLMNIIDSDLLVVCAGQDHAKLLKGRDIEDEWAIELNNNLRIIADIAGGIKNIKNKTILVYTNPIDITSLYFHDHLDKSNGIYGFGANLDTLRLNNLVGKKGYIIGEHGKTIVPVGISDQKEKLLKTRKIILDSVRKITKARGFTSVSVEHASRILFDAIFLNKDLTVPLSCFHEKQNIFIGSLCRVMGFKITQKKLRLNKAEKQMFEESVGKIKALVKTTRL